MNMLFTNPTFINLKQTKYKFVEAIFDKKSVLKEDQNPIKDNLLMIINNDYLYNYYGCPDNGKMVDIPEQVVMEELLKFYKMIIC